jgi:hypothetical protein
MKEAIILCLCRSVHIPDIGLVLEKDQQARLPESTVARSRDLTYAIQMGAVRLSYRTVCQQQRPAKETNKRPFRLLGLRRPVPRPLPTPEVEYTDEYSPDIPGMVEIEEDATPTDKKRRKKGAARRSHEGASFGAVDSTAGDVERSDH